jgi:hypothetical protein
MINKVTTHAISYVHYFNGPSDPQTVSFEICLPVITPENLEWALRLNEAKMCGINSEDAAGWLVGSFDAFGDDICFTARGEGHGNPVIGGVIAKL